MHISIYRDEWSKVDSTQYPYHSPIPFGYAYPPAYAVPSF